MSMSYWTKRRKIRAKMQESIQNICNNDVISHDQNVQSVTDNSTGDEPQSHMSDTLHDFSEHSDQAPVNDYEWDAEFDQVCENEPLADSSDDEETTEFNLRQLIFEWAVEHQITHTALKDLLGILRQSHPELPKDPRTLLSSMKIDVQPLAGGSYYHFGMAKQITTAIQNEDNLKNHDCLNIKINIDGLPIFKSSKSEFWPILGLLEESVLQQPFVIGIFYGSGKPNSAIEYLATFVQEMSDLQDNGMIVDGHATRIRISSVICDTPARAFVKSTKLHSGYSGCDKCTQSGVYSKRMSFPETDARLRTDISFDEMSDAAHHKGPNPFAGLSLKMVTQFPLDPMHLIHLGVMKRLLLMWMKGPLVTRIGKRATDLISECLLSMQAQVPKDFARKPRSLSEIDRWKATEFRLFLLYTGMIALKGKIASALYDNFMLLSVGIHLLTNPCLSSQFTHYAHELLICFVQHYAAIYGADMIVYNVHGLVHLAEDVKNWGPLETFSAYPFENYLHSLKKLVRKPNHVLQQVVQRLLEKAQIPAMPRERSNQLVRLLTKPHNQGPLPVEDIYLPCTQYKEVHLRHGHFKTYAVCTNLPDNCVKINGKVALVRNIFECHRGVYIMYEIFSSCEPFFHYPMNSSLLDIHKVKNPNSVIHIASVHEIEGKYILLSNENTCVALPIIHTH